MGPVVSVPYRVTNTKAKALNLSGRQIKAIEFEDDYDIQCEYLDLSNNQIEELPIDLKRLKSLNLTRNSLQELPPETETVFETYESLKTINLSYNFLTEIPEFFSELSNLEELIVFSNRLSRCFLKDVHVKVLDLGQNQFISIPQFNASLEVLTMDFNRITSITYGLPKLTKLCLNMNQISSISKDVVFPALTTLDISRNQLESLPDLSVFSPVLEQIDASFNQISELPKLPPSISDLRFSKNLIEKLPDNLDEYTNLTYIDFSCNKLKYVGKLPFTIQSVILFDNQIEKIEDCETPDLHALEISRNCLEQYPAFRINEITELSLFSNHLRELRADCFYEKIYKLDVSDNQLTHLPADLFKLATLVHLNVARNQIKSFPPNISSSPLIYFCISENPIEQLPDLLPIPLEQLYMADCGLNEIPDSIIRNEELVCIVAPGNNITKVPYIPTLQKANFSCNKLKQMPILPPTIESIDLTCNEIEEIPNNLNLPLLIDMNVSYNKIKSLPTSFTAPKLKSFSIAHNPISGEWKLTLPHLDKLDISNTEVKASSVPQIGELVISDWSLDYAHTIICGPGVAYAQRRRPQNNVEDGIIANADAGVFGIVNCACDATATRDVCAKVAAIIVKQEHLDSKAFEGVTDDAMMIMNSEPTQGETLFAMALVQKQSVTVVRTGGVHVLVVRKDGTISFALKNRTPTQPIDRRSISFYRSRDSLGVMQALGDQLVFGGDDDLSVKTVETTENDKWLIIASDIVFNVVDENLLQKITVSSTSPAQLSYWLRNITMGHMYNQKISVMAVDLESE